MLSWIIGIYSLYTFLKIYLSIMQIGYINVEKNRDAVILSKSQYFVAGNYAVRKEKLSIVESFVDYLVFYGCKVVEWIQKTLGVMEIVV